MAESTSRPIAVLGAGSFGTALAILLSRKGEDVRLWARREDQVQAINRTRRNPRYLTDVELPPSLQATSDPRAALKGVGTLVLVTPTHALKDAVAICGKDILSSRAIVCAAKGIENETFFTPTRIVAQCLPEVRDRLAALSGPSFAREIVQEVPTAVTVACHDEQIAKEIQSLFSTGSFRVYTSTDVVGVELGGALKNVIAIAAGICDGLQFGHNARAALITRGLAEITRMAVKVGAMPETLSGLSGLGDLVLTCTGDLSRNRTVGMRLGKGESLQQILASMTMVAEGVRTTKSAFELSRRYGVEMPITSKIYEVLYQSLSPRKAVEDLMRRELKSENRDRT